MSKFDTACERSARRLKIVRLLAESDATWRECELAHFVDTSRNVIKGDITALTGVVMLYEDDDGRVGLTRDGVPFHLRQFMWPGMG